MLTEYFQSLAEGEALKVNPGNQSREGGREGGQKKERKRKTQLSPV